MLLEPTGPGSAEGLNEVMHLEAASPSGGAVGAEYL